MKTFRRRGKRIRASDVSLVFQYVVFGLVGVWLISFVPFPLSFLLCTTWQLDLFQADFISTYGLVSLVISLVMVACCVFLYYRYRYDRIRQINQRQKLAKMLLENGWYETKQVQSSSLFEDIPNGKTKDKISYFPKMYYRLEKALLHIQVEITLGKYQEQLLNLENKLESGLYCDLVSKELHDSFVEYILLYDTINSRISIDEVIAQNGSLKLMDAMYWEYDSLPHMLIAGGTGGGKTYF